MKLDSSRALRTTTNKENVQEKEARKQCEQRSAESVGFIFFYCAHPHK